MIYWFAACTTQPSGDESPPKGTDTAALSLDETGTDPTGSVPTGDTGEPITEWNGLYPLVPYDCAQGVPPGPFSASRVDGVFTTEDFAIDTDGWLVASDWDRNLLRFTVDGELSVFVPDAADTRGIDVLPDRDIVLTNETLNQLMAVHPDGTMSPIAGAGASPSGIDVAVDGTLYVGDISTGGIYEILPDGSVSDLGPAEPGGGFIQTYGVALSLDESVLYVTQYNGNKIYRLQRDETGRFGPPSIWTTVDGFGLAGAAVDACDNLYVIASFGCRIFRITPQGDVETLAILDVPGDYCPSLAFGRDVGGWDPLTLYVSTYDILAKLEIGVPGKPR